MGTCTAHQLPTCRRSWQHRLQTDPNAGHTHTIYGLGPWTTFHGIPPHLHEPKTQAEEEGQAAGTTCSTREGRDGNLSELKKKGMIYVITPLAPPMEWL